MKKYITPTATVTHMNAYSSILAASNSTITGGGSNAGQDNPTAETKRFGGWNKDIWADDEE